MKKIKCLLTALIFVASTSINNAQQSKEHLRDFKPQYKITSFKVYGNCSMCTLRILKTLQVKGIKIPYWKQNEQILTIMYDEKIIKLNTVYSLLAAAGHDTQQVKAKDEIYNALPKCCHYLREPILNISKVYTRTNLPI